VAQLQIQLEKMRKNYENERARVTQLEKEKEARLQEMLSKPDVSSELRREIMYKDEELKGKVADLEAYRKSLNDLQKEYDTLEEEVVKLREGLSKRNRIIKKLRVGLAGDSLAKDSELASELDVSGNLDDLDLGKDSLGGSEVFARGKLISGTPTQGVRVEKTVTSKSEAQKYFPADPKRKK
jgi:chromosome segregation ATPase